MTLAAKRPAIGSKDKSEMRGFLKAMERVVEGSAKID